ncbi:MAG: calcium-binding protein [Pseudomonadota bacterium]
MNADTFLDDDLVSDFAKPAFAEDFEILNASSATSGDDEIATDNDDQVIDALAGNDTVTTGTGDDSVTGNLGNDTIETQAGNDTLFGDEGDDELVAGAGSDLIYGGDDDDTAFGDQGADSIFGGRGNDFLNGVGASDDGLGDYIEGGQGNDEIVSGRGADLIYGGTGNDSISGVGGADTIFGDDGDDQLIGGGDLSTLYGGDGDDTIFSGSTFEFIYGGDGDDLIDAQTQQQFIHDFIWAGDGNDSVIASNFGDGIRGGAGNDTINANGAPDIVFGDEGDDILNGGTGNDTLRGGLDNDTLNGGSGSDTLEGNEGDDWFIGSSGTDLHFGGSGSDTLDLSAFTLVPTIDLAAGSIGASLNRIVSIENYVGASGADSVVGSADDNSISGLAGNDTLFGAAGNDTLEGGLGADSLDGGSGIDDLISYASSATGVVVDLSTNSVSGGDATGDTIAGFEHVVGTEQADVITGTAGDNSIGSGGGADLIFLQHGGTDQAYGGDGNDGIFFGAAFDPDDAVDGGEGSADQIALQGDYSGGLVFSPNSAVGIEQVILLPGNITSFGAPGNELYSYDITLVDANIQAGRQLAFQANQLRAAENFTLDASAELDGSIFTFAGLGSETIIGSQKDDSFFFGTDRFGPGDQVDGQDGVFDSVGLQGDYSTPLTFGANQLIDIEILALLSNTDTRFGAGSGTPYNYNVTTDDGNVAAGDVLVISANTLALDEVLIFDGSAETDGRYSIFSGNSMDQIIGSQGGDIISGRGAVDILTGGDGNDTFVYTNVTDSQGLGDQITDFTTGDLIRLSTIDADMGLPGNQAFTFIGGANFSNTAGELRAVNTVGNTWLVEADNNGDGFVDLTINVTTSDGSPIDAADFIL